MIKVPSTLASKSTKSTLDALSIVLLPGLNARTELFQWCNSWLTIFFTCAHVDMLYLFVHEKSTSFIVCPDE